MPEIKVLDGPKEFLRNISPEHYRKAYESGMSFSAWLEREQPSEEYKDGLDAFERLLKVAGIRTTSFSAQGVYADRFEAFHRKPEYRALVPEWASRQWRRVSMGGSVNTRSLYASDDSVPGSLMRPYQDAQAPRIKGLAPAIPLAELIAITTPIDGPDYRAYYLTDVTAEERKVRVTEGAEVPTAKLTGGEHTIKLHKFGRALLATYEQLRRQPIDRISLHIQRMAIQAEVDKVTAALDIMVNGDGNSNTSPTTHNLTTLDTAASAGTLTLKGWIAFKMKFANPYTCTSALMQEAVALQLTLLNTGSANIPQYVVNQPAGFGSFTAINPGLSDGVRIGWTSDAPSLKIVGFDRRLSLEMVTEIGADITEVERYVSNQTQKLVQTEVMGFASFDNANATRILNVNA